jgi:glucosamine-6-phosphate deaminase
MSMGGPTGPKSLKNSEGLRIPAKVFGSSFDAVQHVTRLIAGLIRERKLAGRSCVLGLPTGSTPVGVYRELVRLHKSEGLDFSNVVTFNLDEYYPIAPDAAQSYHRFMRENLFDHVNIPPKNIHIPDGTTSYDDLQAACEKYERQIRDAGGIDLMLLGIGRTGHIGFNEPGSSLMSRTRLVRLDPVTRRDTADAFNGEENVPTQGITMGVWSILDARQIVLMAFGEHKSKIVTRSLEGEMSESIPASVLQKHDNCTFILDEPAASGLTFYRTPWLVSSVAWTPEIVRRAVLWLSARSGKALLKLTAADFREHDMHELLREHGPAQGLCRRIFDEMMTTLCDNPGGPEKRRVLCFSPHPDDDVISMGGTLINLERNGHDVHIAYMTSGNVAVFDHDAIRFLDFVTNFNRIFGIENEKTADLEKRITDFLARKEAGQIDSEELLGVKGLIRKTEAIAGARAINVPEGNLHFLDLPFYRTGRKRKNPIGDADVQIVLDLLRKLKPAQAYVAGDLADPHGTHRVCAEAIFAAAERYRSEGGEVEVWMYRGAWQEWEPWQIERAVPMTPDDLEKKKSAIFRHQSQKDRPMFAGYDEREFWQRAEERNMNTALLYDKLGLPEYYAMEGFVQWKGQMP